MNMAQRDSVIGSNSETQAQEIPQKLLSIEKKQYRVLKIMMAANIVLAAAIVIALLVVIPKVVTVADEAQSTMTEIQKLSDSAGKSLEGIDDTITTANKTIKDAGKLLEDNAEAVEDALTNINEIDFESLNKAIRDLAQAVEPLAKLGSVFS